MRKPFFACALAAGLGLIASRPIPAQTFTTLYNFSTVTGPYRFEGTNNDGAFPIAALVQSGNTFYGTAAGGGTSANGTVFAVNIDGTGFTNLHIFAGTGDGSGPYAPLTLSGNTLYGTAYYGNKNQYSGNGTVFKVNNDGTGFATLATLAGPQGLTLSGNILYGAASGLFDVDTNGEGLATFYAFPVTEGEYYTNSDGSAPIGPLVLSGGILYGTGTGGGSAGNGTVFKVNTYGSSFAVLHTFSATSGSYFGGTNTDGGYPGTLVLAGDTLYGAAYRGGGSSNGTVFALNTNGTGFTVLHSFPATFGPNSTNYDGANPSPYVMLAGNTLYGTTLYGGTCSNGTVYAINTDGSGFKVLHAFTAFSGPNLINSDGGYPYGGLIMSDNILYGTAEFGGSGGSGTIFSISLPPQLAITASGPNVILTWPTNVAGLTLQSTPSLVVPVAWTPVSPGPVVVNGLNTVTNPMIGSQHFYRLRQ
jgi:uncharacterized repeat protein (TIGR03803 family)